ANLITNTRHIGSLHRQLSRSRYGRDECDLGNTTIFGIAINFCADWCAIRVAKFAYIVCNESFVRGDLPVAAIETEYEEIAIAEARVIMIELCDCNKLISLQFTDGSDKHGLCFVRSAEFGAGCRI